MRRPPASLRIIRPRCRMCFKGLKAHNARMCSLDRLIKGTHRAAGKAVPAQPRAGKHRELLRGQLQQPEATVYQRLGRRPGLEGRPRSAVVVKAQERGRPPRRTPADKERRPVEVDSAVVGRPGQAGHAEVSPTGGESGAVAPVRRPTRPRIYSGKPRSRGLEDKQPGEGSGDRPEEDRGPGGLRRALATSSSSASSSDSGSDTDSETELFDRAPTPNPF
jgi:hypothetical protein